MMRGMSADREGRMSGGERGGGGDAGGFTSARISY